MAILVFWDERAGGGSKLRPLFAEAGTFEANYLANAFERHALRRVARDLVPNICDE